MRLYTVSIVCRMNDAGEPAFEVGIDVEDGIPEVVIGTIGKAVQNIGKEIERQHAAGTVNVIERN